MGVEAHRQAFEACTMGGVAWKRAMALIRRGFDVPTGGVEACTKGLDVRTRR